LTWGGAPEGTQSFTLIADDPDAPDGTWVHWVLYDIPPTLTSLPENVAKEKTVEGAGIQGVNSFGRIGYGGPCPPSGSLHRYFFKLYALDTLLNIKPGASKYDVEKAMKGHTLAKVESMGKFSR
jgi:Raf kinase inhibitor-like YbhB/YbcL family protein